MVIESGNRSVILGILAIVFSFVNRQLDAHLLVTDDMQVFVVAFSFVAIMYGIKEFKNNPTSIKGKIGVVIGAIVMVIQLFQMINMYIHLSGGFYS